MNNHTLSHFICRKHTFSVFIPTHISDCAIEAMAKDNNGSHCRGRPHRNHSCLIGKCNCTQGSFRVVSSRHHRWIKTTSSLRTESIIDINRDQFDYVYFAAPLVHRVRQDQLPYPRYCDEGPLLKVDWLSLRQKCIVYFRQVPN